MRARAGGAVVIALALAVSPACEIVRPLDLHPDVVALAALLVAGEREARMLAVHPHRTPDQAPPLVAAMLRGPGWEVGFRYTLNLEACTLAGLRHPATCLGADLPEPVRPGREYGIRGTAPLGPFTGEVTVPRMPRLLEPQASVTMPLPQGISIVLPMRFQTDTDIGTLLADVTDVFVSVPGGGEQEIPASHLGSFPQRLEGAETDTITLVHYGRPLRFALQLLGIGRNYTNFLGKAGLDPVPRPWPSFGIEGEGAYGYFDGATPSRISRIVLR